jgi:hypothetical protein
VQRRRRRRHRLRQPRLHRARLASSTHEDARLWKANDSNTSTALNQGWVNRRGTDVRNGNQWIQLDFGVTRTVVRAVIYTTSGYALRAFQIQIWNGGSYVPVGSVSNNASPVIYELRERSGLHPAGPAGTQ